jgi:mRNA interferase RelE/StbE
VPIRVELIDEAVADLAGYAESGNLKLILAKLVQLERDGAQAGQPLGRRSQSDLATWRKIVVGNRDWRIVFRTDPDETVATVCVIGDRADAAVYEEAQARLKSIDDRDAISLAEAMLAMMGSRKQRKQAAKRRRR